MEHRNTGATPPRVHQVSPTWFFHQFVKGYQISGRDIGHLHIICMRMIYGYQPAWAHSQQATTDLARNFECSAPMNFAVGTCEECANVNTQNVCVGVKRKLQERFKSTHPWS